MRQHFTQSFACILAWSILSGSAVTAWADEIPEPKSVAEETLDILRATGTINDSQYRDLSERARKEEALRLEAVDKAIETATLPAVSAAPSPEAGPTDWKFKWSNGFKLERNDGAFKLKFGGRIQSDWAVVELNERLEDTIGGEGHGTEFRRARLFFSGTVYERVIFKAQYDFAGGDADFKDVYVGLKDLGPLGTVKVGHFKEPFSLEEQTSSKYITFMERALPNVFSPGRNTGFTASNAVMDKRLLWGVAVTKDAGGYGNGFGDNADWNVTARLVGVPLYENDGEKVVHLGFGYSHQFRGGSGFMLDYEQGPESHLAPDLVSTGDISTNDINLINTEIAIVCGPASFQAEYMHSFVQGDGGAKDTSFWGIYAQASYFLTGEHRNYKLGSGSFSRVKPNANFDPAKGDWGGFEVGVRFSYLDLNDEFVRGGKMWDITAGINWHLFPNTRFSLNYVHSELDDRFISPGDVDGNADIVQARFQLDF